jgi:hypothetical protein
MGHREHRAGWYTPHLLDRLMWGQRLRSADEIIPELQDLRAGDRVPDSADGSVYYIVRECQPRSHIVFHSRSHAFGPAIKSDSSSVFALVPEGGRQTRLYVRVRVSYAPLWLYPVLETILNIGDLVNARSMLRGIKNRAEGRHLRPSDRAASAGSLPR